MTKSASFLLALVFIVSSGLAQASQYKRGENISLTGKYSENVFAAGRQVSADLDSTDDLFLAGGQIESTARTTENMYMAGGQIHLSKTRAREATMAGGTITVAQALFRELIVAGGDVNIDQTKIQDDLVLAGGKVVVGRDAQIKGGVTMVGNDVAFDGNVSKDSLITGQNVRIAGNFGGNVRVYANHLDVQPGTVIAGDLIHSARSLTISPIAQIRGRNEAVPMPQQHAGSRATGFWAAMFFVGCLLIPGLIVLLFPSFTGTARNDIRAFFWEDLGKGTLLFFLVPVILIALFVSIIGLPVGLVAIPFLAVAGIVAWSIAVFFTGDQIRLWLRRNKPATQTPLSKPARFGWTVLGAVALMFILSIPLLGFVFCLILFLAGVGAVYTGLRSFQKPLTTAD